MSSPGTSGYPGTPFMIVIVCACVFMVIRYVIKWRKIKQNSIRQQIQVPTNAFPFVPIFLLILALFSIVLHYKGK